ncbi:exonuclease domain-containing protein [Hahella sp. CR1]|uniref:exonuclease domain-containing protein n=1 Tax=Hahella sp. CR1 TaxID=2992807 RepID=UPI002441C584|nr:exonuclease domain-containing protein [Hahella sp. CR1]MDG9668961.1 exonuclease domain-containing protein [Hahella sp. CR1]
MDLPVKPDYYLIIDLEATCCDQGSVPRREMETIEIGAVMVDAASLAVVDEFQTFIRPVRHPQLTDFCRGLTTIKQKQVDDAPTYPEAIESLQDWMRHYPNYLFCSWGDYDKGQFEQDCQYHRVAYPFASGHLNIKKQFSETQGLKKKYGMAGALRVVGLSLEGCHHRGIDDARNMAKLMPYIVVPKIVVQKK